MEAVTSSDDYCSASFSQGDSGTPTPPPTTTIRPGHAVRYSDEFADLGTRSPCARLNGISKQASRITQQRPYIRDRSKQLQWGPEHQHQTPTEHHQQQQHKTSGPRLTFYEIESPAQRLQQQERAAGKEVRFGPDPGVVGYGRQVQPPNGVHGALPGYDQLHPQQPPPPPRYRQPPRYQQQEHGYTEVSLGPRCVRPGVVQETRQPIQEAMRPRHEPEGQQQHQAFRGTVNAILRAGEIVQGRPCERAALRIDRCVPRMPVAVAAETAELKYYGPLVLPGDQVCVQRQQGAGIGSPS
ncbi:hypothetical protein QAD02_012513 [Eretmocerus hayati]|uniref:Uncharacterized protein n=1 Tax=Eretmocerus hayati TaxID=131215 RepID=A0ACC2P0Y5_9HYME|nr:hypothetical protein QAD02_012513 [Eretmocerus hayati]